MNQTWLTYVKLAAAAIGAQLGMMLGKMDGLLYALLIFIAVDYISGFLVGIKDRKLSSAVGFRGIAKKVFILLLVVVANTLDMYVLGSGAMVRGLVIAFYIANEGLSILENAGRLGVPYPERLRDVLMQMKEDGDGD